MKLSKEARELVARMTEDAALWEMLEAQANELGQAFIGGEGHLVECDAALGEELAASPL